MSQQDPNAFVCWSTEEQAVRIRLSVVVGPLCLFALSLPAASAPVCKDGSYVTAACQQVLASLVDNANHLVQCLQRMQDEYNGLTGNGAGKGKNYKVDKAFCMQLIKSIQKPLASAASSLDADEDAQDKKESLDNALEAVKTWAGKQ
jgi:hypothetical protein